MRLSAIKPVRLSHTRAVFLMVLITLMWATAGVMTRQVQSAHGFEITFWRSVLGCLSMLVLLRLWRGPQFLQRVIWNEPVFWLSSLCWALMMTSFMMALSYTTVANVLVISALGPMVTAVASSVFLRSRLPKRTWIAIAVATGGIVYIYAAFLTLGNWDKLKGSAIALLVPVATASQWIVMNAEKQRGQRAQEQGHVVDARDMVPALAVGCAISALMCLPFISPLQASWPDLAWLGALGVFQLAIPCALAIVVSRILLAPEISMLALLEIIFGILLTWWGAGEVPGINTLVGGTLVVGALATNEYLGWRQNRWQTNGPPQM